MVLDHVPERPGPVVVRPAPSGHPVGLGHRDLDVIDVPAVEERLEDAVAEPEREQVLNRLLSQVMVDTEREGDG